jgi:RHS repeat-associated protein
MIKKNIPGAEPVYMVYDKRDNLVLTQDGEARAEDPYLYYFTKYDAFNRPVMTGRIYIDDDISDIRDNFEDFSGQPYVTYDDSETPYGYSLDDGYPSGYTIDENDILTVTYYDNDDFVDDILSSDYECSTYNETHNNIDFNLDKSDMTQDFVTGSMTRVLRVSGSGYIPDDSILFTVNYYDDYGNVIRSISDNHKGGKDIISTNYKPITYEVENTLHLHEGIGDDLRILRRFDYDHTGRLIETTHQINNQDEVVISALEYNEISDLITKYLHSGDAGSTKDFLQKTDYVYNIRGWLKSINNLSIDVNNDAFGIELYYENVSEISNLVSNALYNGNIAGVKWRIKNDMIRGYGYEYDDLSRLTDAHYGDGANLDEHSGYYSMSVPVPSYDENGNILKLKRYFSNTLVDDLTYNYYGLINQLQSVTDNGTASSQVDDYPGTSGTYTYDDNGNMDHDGGKNLDIGYNYLNLPEAIDFGGDNKLFYHFDASGNKLVKYKDVSMGTDEVTHYIGEIVYSDNDIDYILTEEGRIVPYEAEEGTRWLYEYYMKDHLGNTRAVFNGTNLGGNIDMLQHSSYYPFGLAFNLVDYNTSTTSDYTENKYLYNNKELQDDMMQSKKLDWYDYGARMYDPQLGRFHTLDAFAEKYYDFTPYQYGANNPVLFIDVNGDSIHVAEEYRESFNNDIQNVFSDNAEYFEHTESGMLVFTGDKKSLTKEQKQIYKGMKKLMGEEKTTNVVYEESYTVGTGEDAKTYSTAEFGGALTARDVNINGEIQDLIVVSPTISGVNVSLDTPIGILTNTQEFVQKNTTSGLFHEIGEAITTNLTYRGKVIEYENKVRSIIGLPLRPYDLNHSKTIPTIYKK